MPALEETNLETPVEEKQWWQSNSMWAAILSFALGMAQSVSDGELVNTVATFVNANKDDLVGVVLQAIGLYAAWATLRRKTSVVIGK